MESRSRQESHFHRRRRGLLLEEEDGMGWNGGENKERTAGEGGKHEASRGQCRVNAHFALVHRRS